jgi:hypothetical protein
LEYWSEKRTRKSEVGFRFVIQAEFRGVDVRPVESRLWRVRKAQFNRASRDPERFDFPLVSWIPGLAQPRIKPAPVKTGVRGRLPGSPGMTVFSNCDTTSQGKVI